MKVELKRYEILLSEPPKNSIPGGILVIDNKLKSFLVDVVADKEVYPLPESMSDKDVASIYLRIK